MLNDNEEIPENEIPEEAPKRVTNADLYAIIQQQTETLNAVVAILGRVEPFIQMAENMGPPPMTSTGKLQGML